MTEEPQHSLLSSVDRAGQPDAVPDRWPRWVFTNGEEPDVRFTFANERTFLAWIRTSLALIAAAVALDTVDPSWPAAAQVVLTCALLVAGLVGAAACWWRWASAERALRLGRPLPSAMLLAWLSFAVVVSGAGVVTLLLVA